MKCGNQELKFDCTMTSRAEVEYLERLSDVKKSTEIYGTKGHIEKTLTIFITNACDKLLNQKERLMRLGLHSNIIRSVDSIGKNIISCWNHIKLYLVHSDSYTEDYFVLQRKNLVKYLADFTALQDKIMMLESDNKEDLLEAMYIVGCMEYFIICIDRCMSIMCIVVKNSEEGGKFKVTTVESLESMLNQYNMIDC